MPVVPRTADERQIKPVLVEQPKQEQWCAPPDTVAVDE
jgi:hypothetical protein